MPISFITAMASGLTTPDGLEPAEKASTLSPPSVRAKPSAICERQEFSTQTNKILVFFSATMFHHFGLDHVDNIFDNIGRVIGDPFQMTGH